LLVERDFDVVVVGELNADLILAGDVTPAFGQIEKLLDDATLTIGSSSAIFACGAARLGLRTAFIGKAGDDEFGHFMRRALVAQGIDTSGIVTDAHLKTGLSVILSRGDDRAILTYLGTIAALRFDEINLDLIGRARHLHLGSYFLLDSLIPDIPRLFRAAHEGGLTVSLDTNYDPQEQWDSGLQDALRHADIFLPNETELCAIGGSRDVPTALRSLSQRVPIVAVKQGAQGATAQQGEVIACAESIPVKVVDTTGAGDSFNAGFVYGYLAGWPLARALRLGCICGALSTRTAGGTGTQATSSEALALLT
jgi:sugar/nucleoside kinase (ribokinase family)